MSGCHEPTKSTNELLIESIDNCNKSFENLRKLIKINEIGLNKCFEWAEKISERLAIMEKWNASHCKIGLDCEEKIRNLESYYDLKRDTRKDLNASLSAIQDDYKNKIEKLEANISKVHDLVTMEDRITACDVLNRLATLEVQSTKDAIHNQNCFQNLVNEIKRLDGFIHPDLILWARTDVTGRIEALEALSKTQVEINKNSDYDERINDIEKINAEKRLIALETHKNYQTEENRKVSKRIDEICNNFDENRVLIHRESHPCPICEGKGFVFLMYSITDSHQVECKSCKGKGIVWN